MEFLLLGYILGSFSLDGTVKILSKTNLAELRYKVGNKVLISKSEDDEKISYTVNKFRHNGDFDFVKFDEIKTKEEADSLKSYGIYVEKDSSILKEGYFFFSDLEECNVYSESKFLGKVIKVEEFPAQLTLRVKTNEGKDFFVPFIKEFIKSVSIEEKKIEINLIEGML